MNSIYFILLLFLCFQSSVLADYKGCPENSVCNKEMGESLLDWQQSWSQAKSLNQKNKLLRSKGIPTLFYFTPKDNLDDKAFWNSKCAHHKKENIFQAISLNKKIKNDKHTFFQPIRVYQKKWLTYLTPIDFTPLKIKNQKLQGFIEWENQLISLEVSMDGSIELINLPQSVYKLIQEQERVSCPELKTIKTHHSKYFLDKYCHRLQGNRTQLIAMRYWSCP